MWLAINEDSLRRLLLDRQQFNTATRRGATHHSPPNDFHRRHIRKSHGEVLLPQLLARGAKAFVAVNKLGALGTRRAVEDEVEPRRNWLATNYDRIKLKINRSRQHQLGRRLCGIFLRRR